MHRPGFRWMAIVLAWGLTTGCAPAESNSGNNGPGGLRGDFEFFSFWTAPGEAEGLDALLRVFSNAHPNVVVTNATVESGGGAEARVLLGQRMAAGRPPDSFQIHAGHELTDTYVASDKMESLTLLFQEEGWLTAMPPELVDILSFNGEIYSVPVNIHRANVLWYNKSVFAQHNLQPPTTWQEFFVVADVLQAAQITPLGLGQNWTQVALLENVLLSTLGPDAYRGLFTGVTAWDGAQVTAALTTFDRVLGHVQPDFASAPGEWTVITGRVADGTAAMTIMGDWAEGYFKSLGKTPDVDFGWAAAPGTSGSFDLLSDTFALPKGAANREAALAWLKVAGSKAGQDAFNPRKGSIPARTDAERTLYDTYLVSTMDDFSTRSLVPSLAHGAAVSPAWLADVTNAVDAFVISRSVASFQSALAAACVTATVCQ